jgi:hypothetical protein
MTITLTHTPGREMIDGESKWDIPEWEHAEYTVSNCFSFIDLRLYWKSTNSGNELIYKVEVTNNAPYQINIRCSKWGFGSGGRDHVRAGDTKSNSSFELKDGERTITFTRLNFSFPKEVQEKYGVSVLSDYLECGETANSYLSKAKAEKENKSKKESTNDQKDFWSGKDDKKREVNDNKKDDFWSGGSGKKDKQDSNKETDFWKGKGTTAEEKRLTENTKPDKSDQFIGNVRSRTGRIRIYCEDTGKEDGDLVRITNNGRVLKDKIFLTNAGKSYWFDLKFGQNSIEILALNQGEVGANTAAFKVFDDKGNQIAEKSWHLETGYKGKLLILKL